MRAARLFAPYRRKVAVWLSITLVASLLGVAAPLLTKYVFDRALFHDGGPRVGLLGFLVGLMLAAVLLGGVLAIVQTYLANVIGQNVMHDLRQQLYGHLRQMSLRFFTSTRSGEIHSRIASDVGGIGMVVTQTGATVVGSTVFVLASLAGMFYLSWPLTLASLVVVPAFVVLAHHAGKMRRQIARSTQETLAEMSVITHETLSLSGALLTKMFDPLGASTRRYREESERLARLRVRQELVSRALLGLSQTFFLAAPALIYLFAGILLAGGSSWHITAGTLVAFTALQARLFSPIRELLALSLELNASSVLFARIFEYLDLPHDVTDRPGAKPLVRSQVRGAIALRNVSFRYDGNANGKRPWTLRDVTLSIEPGQLAAIVGPSGAGKTTISYLVPRLYDVQEGSVEIDGADVRSVTLASLADVIGMVTQETHLLHTSVRDNLLYAAPEATDTDIARAARAAHIHERILELPDGYETIVGARGYRLSGGEKQRLALARVVLKDPRILILDEATSSLDTVSERLVQDALASVVAGRTTIAIAHRLSTIMAADVIFVLDEGRLVEQGTHDELLTRGGLYARLCEQQFRSGLIEARCEDGVVLASGEVVSLAE